MDSRDSLGRDEPGEVDHDTVPPARTGLLVVAGILLAIPVVALMWVGSYSRVEPKLGGFPFFFWYQFLWVFLCSALTYTAYRLVLVARPHRPMTDDRDDSTPDDPDGFGGAHRAGTDTRGGRS